VSVTERPLAELDEAFVTEKSHEYGAADTVAP
jgi:hypothetical protein